MKIVNHFEKFAKFSDGPVAKNFKQAVIYTRVSSKEQEEKNMSLTFQKKIVLEYAQRNEFQIIDSFGGTYESATTDGRKEFQRMLDFIKSKNGSISHILVYTTSRFSRTGADAMAIVKKLREKYNICLLAVTQPTDASTVSGAFQQDIQLLFSKYDNDLRRQGAMDGMRESYESGRWCHKPPMGYDVVAVNKERKIVINDTGRLLEKAFTWKAEGVKNEVILRMLGASGVKIYKQKLSMIFSNPFYCGLVVTKMLNGKIVQGEHPAIVSQPNFLLINEIRAATANKYGVMHQKEIFALPLKVFVKCDSCGNSFTGYHVKPKNKYYYKCRTIGCKCNKNADKLNALFRDHLINYMLKPHLVAPLRDHMRAIFHERNKSIKEQETSLKARISELDKMMETLFEKFHILEQIPEEMYRKLHMKYSTEKTDLTKVLGDCQVSSSNFEEYLNSVFELSAKLNTAWDSSPVAMKEKLQKLIFPEGIYYNLEKHAFRTEKINEAFSLIARLNSVSGENKKGQDSLKAILSNQVG